MKSLEETHADRIRSILTSAHHVHIIAPFMKRVALDSLIKVIPNHCELKCVTRWLPKEVAEGVSDLDILVSINERDNSELLLLDRLHAKFFIADSRCLVGSANVTLRALGESDSINNIESLVETTTDNPDVAKTIDVIFNEATPATCYIADSVRRQASLLNRKGSECAFGDWYPTSWQPELGFKFYKSPIQEFSTLADRLTQVDVQNAEIKLGLQEDEFVSEVRKRLEKIPIAADFLQDAERTELTLADVRENFQNVADAQFAANDLSANDLWKAFVEWMSYFYADKVFKQPVTEIALRKGQIVR